MNCEVCGKDEVVWSGVDAWVLGIPTEKVCYGCAAIYNKVIGINEKYAQKVSEVSE